MNDFTSGSTETGTRFRSAPAGANATRKIAAHAAGLCYDDLPASLRGAYGERQTARLVLTQASATSTTRRVDCMAQVELVAITGDGLVTLMFREVLPR